MTAISVKVVTSSLSSALELEEIDVFTRVTTKGVVILHKQKENDLCVLVTRHVHYSAIFD
jgi:hypothetical protein